MSNKNNDIDTIHKVLGFLWFGFATLFFGGISLLNLIAALWEPEALVAGVITGFIAFAFGLQLRNWYEICFPKK